MHTIGFDYCLYIIDKMLYLQCVKSAKSYVQLCELTALLLTMCSLSHHTT